MGAGDVPDERDVVLDVDELLTGVELSVELLGLLGGQGALLDGDGHGEGDALEPLADVGHEGDVVAHAGGDLALVDVVGQGVWDQVVAEELGVVLWGGLGTGTGVAGDTEHGWQAVNVLEQGGDGQLGARGVAAWVGDLSGAGNLLPVVELWEAVGPLGLGDESVVGGEVEDLGLAVDALDGLDDGLGDVVWEGHDPEVDVALGLEALDVLGLEVLVDDLGLVVALELGALELTGGDVRDLEVWVVVDQGEDVLAGEASGANETDAAWLGVGADWLRGGSGGVSSGGLAVLEDAGGRGGARGRGSASLLDELADELSDGVQVVDAVPEEDLAVLEVRALGLVEVPRDVRVLL